jgi:CRISPR-associated endoribonuclease Cas6
MSSLLPGRAPLPGRNWKVGHPVLAAIVLHLVSERTVTLPANLGRSNYAMTLDRLESADPALGRAVHEMPTAKPLTCSGLIGVRGATTHTIHRDEVVRVRITALTEAIASALYAVLISERPTSWTLHRQPFRVIEVICDEQRDPWSGVTSYAQLVAQEMSNKQPPESVLRMELAAPVAFRSAGMTVPLPMPGLVFGSLLDRWSAFSTIPLDPELRAIAQGTVGISQFHLTSVPVPQKQDGLEIGCAGEITYNYLGSEAVWLHQLRILAAYAAYSGIGLKTTMGMGQARWVR